MQAGSPLFTGFWRLCCVQDPLMAAFDPLGESLERGQIGTGLRPGNMLRARNQPACRRAPNATQSAKTRKNSPANPSSATRSAASCIFRTVPPFCRHRRCSGLGTRSAAYRQKRQPNNSGAAHGMIRGNACTRARGAPARTMAPEALRDRRTPQPSRYRATCPSRQQFRAAPVRHLRNRHRVLRA